MKTFAMLVAAGLASSAVAQDTVVTIAPAGGTSWSITAAFSGAPGPGPIQSVWSDFSIDLASTDGVISNVDLNAGYDTSFLGAPVITGQGTGLVGIRATMPGGPLIGPDNDSSNPLVAATFDYTGTAAGLQAALDAGTLAMIGQNAIFFQLLPFGEVQFYQDAQGNPGSRSLVFEIVPAPASAALLGLGGLAAARRRR